MLTDRDLSAISSWERNEERAFRSSSSAQAHPYRCSGCDWTGRGETALRHYRETGHAIRGRDWPAGWPDCQWSAQAGVYATFAHMQPDFKGGEFAMYQVHGGERDKSTLSEATVRALGIAIRGGKCARLRGRGRSV